MASERAATTSCPSSSLISTQDNSSNPPTTPLASSTNTQPVATGTRITGLLQELLSTTRLNIPHQLEEAVALSAGCPSRAPSTRLLMAAWTKITLSQMASSRSSAFFKKMTASTSSRLSTLSDQASLHCRFNFQAIVARLLITLSPAYSRTTD